MTRIFKVKISGQLIKLLIEINSNINTYLEVNEDGEPIIKKRKWSGKHKPAKMPKHIKFESFNSSIKGESWKQN